MPFGVEPESAKVDEQVSQHSIEEVILTELVSVGLKVRSDHALEIRGQFADVVVQTQVRVLRQEVVQLRDGLLELISVLELCDDVVDLPFVVVAATATCVCAAGWTRSVFRAHSVKDDLDPARQVFVFDFVGLDDAVRFKH